MCLCMGGSVLQMALLPVVVLSSSGLTSIFASCNLPPSRAQLGPRTKPQWPDLTWILCWSWTWHRSGQRYRLNGHGGSWAHPVSMDWEGRRLVSQRKKKKDAGQVKTIVYSILQIQCNICKFGIKNDNHRLTLVSKSSLLLYFTLFAQFWENPGSHRWAVTNDNFFLFFLYFYCWH